LRFVVDDRVFDYVVGINKVFSFLTDEPRAPAADAGPTERAVTCACIAFDAVHYVTR